ncbi:MAG: hypothetical protein PSV35_07690, partial [bacterium]|nr:hypothetical protein [bacterium]
MTHITKELLQESLIHRVAYVLKYSPIFDKLFKQILIGLKQTIENHPEIQNQLHEIVACTGKITNNKEQAKHFLKSCSAPALVELMNELTRQLSTNNKWLTTMPTDLEFNGNLDTIRESTTSYIEKRYGIIDMRQQTDSRLIRRMDSLARIFSLNPISSVCTAVTFYEGRLIIAANL